MEVASEDLPKEKQRHANFTTSELKFIKKHTKDAPDGTRLSAAKLSLLPEMKRHTKESIAVIIKKNRWADPIRSNYIKFAKRHSKYRKKIFLKFLKSNGRFWPSSIVAKYLKISSFKINRLRKENNLRLRHSKEAMKDPVYREWYESKEQKRLLNLRTAAAKRLIKRKDNLELFLEVFVNKNTKNLKWKICVRCGKRWPATINFFRVKKVKFKSKLKKGMRYYRMDTLCIACPAHKPKK